MQILVQPIPGQPIASLSLDQIRAAVVEGQLHPQALASRDGGASWLPLWQIADISPMPLPMPPKRSGNEAVLRLVAPIGRSVWAIVAGYFGLGAFGFALLWTLVLFAGPPPPSVGSLTIPALVGLIVLAATMGAALLGHRSIRRDSTKHGMGRVVFAYVCSGLLLVSILAGLVRAL